MTPILTTPDRLVLRSRPWMLGIGLIAAMLIFAAIGLAKLGEGNPEEAGKLAMLLGLFAIVFVVFVKQEVAIFDRASGQIVLRRAGVFGQKEAQHPLDGLERATIEVDEGGSSSNSRPLTRPVLLYADGTKVPMTEIFSSGTGSKSVVAAVNAWLGVAPLPDDPDDDDDEDDDDPGDDAAT